jgi:bifunctional DNase/RNase
MLALVYEADGDAAAETKHNQIAADLFEEGKKDLIEVRKHPAEADAIAVKLQGASVPRPLTHDLLSSVVGALGASVNSIIVNDLKNDTFFAKIILNVDGKQLEVDSRPSDALALAVRVDVPIFVEDTVLDKAGILLDKESGKPISDEEAADLSQGKAVTEDEMKKMSAFKDFINSIDLSDFDKRKS